MNNLTYVIIPTANINDIDFAQVVEKKETLRYKLDGSEFIVKFSGGQVPPDLEPYAKRTQDEVLEFIRNPINGWVEEDS
jgi:hypothetical protein|tara:strand:+ start:404 stop:640 length:237 start_codon:yes stop_codon:yes gene_type:complete